MCLVFVCTFSCEYRDYPAVVGSLADLRVFLSSQAEYACFLCV